MAVVIGLLYVGLATNVKRLSEQIMSDELDVCRALIQNRPNDSHALREEVEIDSAVRRYQKFYIRVVDDTGHSLFTTPGMDQELTPLRLAGEAAKQSGIFWLKGASGKPYRTVIARVSHGDAQREFWTIQLAMDLSQELEILSQQRIWVWIVLLIAAVLCTRAGIAAAKWGTHPLREVSETARHIGSSTLNERLRTEGYPSEIASLATTFNAMLQRLEDSFARLSRFSADIAHELRTPVNNIRGESEVALVQVRTGDYYRDTLGSCLEESVRLSDLIESLLFLARCESPGERLNRQHHSILTLLSNVQEYYEAAAAESGVNLRLECDKGLLGNVDGPLLQRALGNLVSNSIAHTSAGGSVLLSATERPRQLYIQVIDTGAGISAEALPKIFERFYRADPARVRRPGGTGLGLSIMRQIVFLHGGDVKIESEVGVGTTVSLILPSSLETSPT